MENANVVKKKKIPKQVRHHLDRRADDIAAINADASDDELLTEDEVANWFKVSTQWLRLGRGSGYGPPFRRIGPNIVRYQRGEVRTWLSQRTHQSSAEYAEETKMIRGRK